MLVHSLAWRKLHGVDYLLEKYEAPEVMKNYFAGAWHHHDTGKQYAVSLTPNYCDR